MSISFTLKSNPSDKLLLDLHLAAQRLAAKDSTLWGESAQLEASERLNWIDLPSSSELLIPQIHSLVEWASSSGLTDVILAGMGGSSLAPEVFAKTFGKNLTVLDTTDPDQIKAAIPSSLSQTVIIVGSKSGSTIETASHKALFTELILEAGLKVADHLVIITDPSSPLDQSSRKEGLRVINADPFVGGRYSALSAFGLVPAALLGIDIAEVLASALTAAKDFILPNSAPINLAAALFESGQQNIGFIDAGSQTPGLGDWVEQLVAESTGKNQTGRLPIVLESSDAPLAGSGFRVSFTDSTSADAVVTGSLGEQFILWEWITALLSIPLGVDPFNQPNVTEAKERTGALLETWSDGKVPVQQPVFESSNLQIFSESSAETLSEQLSEFLTKDSHYISVMAYLARGLDDEILKIRSLLASRTQRGVTFGWGPRFLHSTGQFHKGGQHNGAFIQITGDNLKDVAIPGKNFSFHTLLMAQALGDGEALASRNFPLIRIHLKNREAGIKELLAALA